jgi:hypothetical protein
MNFGSISTLYLLSKTSKKLGWKSLILAQSHFLRGAPVWPVHTTGLTDGTLEVTSSSFWDLSGCKVSYKIPEEVFRGVYTKLERRIGTSKARSVLPIWFLYWNYQNHRYYQAWVRKIAKGSLARPRAVTGLTGGRHQSDWWRSTTNRGPTVNRIYFLPSSFSLLYHSLAFIPIQNRESLPSSLFPPHPSPMEIWSFNHGKTSRLEAKGSPKAPLHFPLRVLWIPLKFFSPKVFKSSFCPIYLLRANIWISLGISSPENP